MLNQERIFLHKPEDHQEFRDRALRQAELICDRRGARLTKLRRRVLEILWEKNQPVGAYEILDVLKREREGAAPPTVYRVLEFLVEHGLVHRIERLNAFLGCRRPAEPHTSQFLICRSCGAVAEIRDARIDSAVTLAVKDAGFELTTASIEIDGFCPRCKANGGDHEH